MRINLNKSGTTYHNPLMKEYNKISTEAYVTLQKMCFLQKFYYQHFWIINSEIKAVSRLTRFLWCLLNNSQYSTTSSGTTRLEPSLTAHRDDLGIHRHKQNSKTTSYKKIKKSNRLITVWWKLNSARAPEGGKARNTERCILWRAGGTICKMHVRCLHLGS